MLNMDFTKQVVIDSNTEPWVQSPMAGVWRKPLAREDAEQGHATSVVKYESGAGFSEHPHPLGEEILVLSGTFSDETGDFHSGTYFRNPEGFSHSPFSKQGCEIFVKLHQFQSDDHQRVCLDTNTAQWKPGPGNLKIMPLHEHKAESVFLVQWPAGERFQKHAHNGGEEVFVISGELVDEHSRYPAGTWIRSPHGSEHYPYVETDTLLWVKTGHLT